MRVAGPRTALFIGLAVLCAWPTFDTPVALTAGILFSLILGNPSPSQTARWSKLLLQVSVVGLGFGIGIEQVLHEGRHAIGYTIVGIAFTLLAGRLIGRRLGVDTRTSHLISFGTAICGGSAIAAMAPVIKARNQDIAVSLGTVFALNSMALLVFPPIGRLLHLSQQSFGLWAALAIHDTSSVVGAAASYGSAALATATTVKLTRALWITPCVVAAGFFTHSGRKAAVPLFILGFVAAAIIRAALPQQVAVWDMIAFAARRLLVVTLFLIGAGLSRSVIRAVGLRPLGQGLILWLLVSATTLLALTQGIIGAKP